LSDAPAFSDELDSDVPSSPVEPSSSTDSSPEQLVRRNHRLHRPSDCYSSAFIATTLSEPASYRDVILHPEWLDAMAEEIAALERPGTLDLVPCPPRAHPITCKWVYKVKTCSDGSLECYKACLVACGFQ
jgi:hypothetical protein